MKIAQIWMEWMFVNVIMYYLSFIIQKIIAYSTDYGQNMHRYRYYTENVICTTYDTMNAEIITALAAFAQTYYKNTKTDKIRQSPIIPEKWTVQKNCVHRTAQSMAQLQQVPRSPKGLLCNIFQCR